MAVHLDNPALLEYIEDNANPFLHLFCRGEDGQLYVLSSEVQQGTNVSGTWTPVGNPQNGWQMAPYAASAVTYVDLSGVRQCQAFVVGQDNQLAALSLNLGAWQWDPSLPPIPSGKVVSQPAAVAYQYDQRWRVVVFVVTEDNDGIRVKALLLDDTTQAWVDFGTPANTSFGGWAISSQIGCFAFDSGFGIDPPVYALVADRSSNRVYMLTWDGSPLSNTPPTWTALAQGQVPATLSTDAPVAKCSIPILDEEAIAVFNLASQAPEDLSVCSIGIVDKVTWNWSDLGHDPHGRTPDTLGVFSFVRVTQSSHVTAYTPAFVAAIQYSDGSLGLSEWDISKTQSGGTQSKVTWSNLGSPSEGGAAISGSGVPCGARLYVANRETTLVFTVGSNGELWMSGPNPYGVQEWTSLGAAPG